jgi:hypothetical protein
VLVVEEQVDPGEHVAAHRDAEVELDVLVLQTTDGLLHHPEVTTAELDDVGDRGAALDLLDDRGRLAQVDRVTRLSV